MPPRRKPGDIDLQTFQPKDNKQARRVIALGIMWYWDHEKRFLFGITFVFLVFAATLGKFLNLDTYQSVVTERIATIGAGVIGISPDELESEPLESIPSPGPDTTSEDHGASVIGTYESRADLVKAGFLPLELLFGEEKPQVGQRRPLVINGYNTGYYYDANFMAWREAGTNNLLVWNKVTGGLVRIPNLGKAWQ